MTGDECLCPQCRVVSEQYDERLWGLLDEARHEGRVQVINLLYELGYRLSAAKARAVFIAREE
jgi:hypothetical protein